MGDLVIGSRRPARFRPRLRHLVALVVVLVVAACLTWWGFVRATALEPPDLAPASARPLSAAEGRLVLGSGEAASSMERLGGVTLVRLRGTPAERGRAHGELAGIDREILDELLSSLRPEVSRGRFARFRDGALFRWAHRRLAEAIAPTVTRELAGLAEATGASYGDVLLAEAALDLGRAPEPDAPRGSVAGGIVFAPGGSAPLVARSFSLAGRAAGLGVVVRIVHAEATLPFVAVGWAGQTGVVSGINAARLAVFTTAAVVEGITPDAVRVPASLLARRVLEEADSLEAATGLIRDTPTLGATTFALVEGKTGRMVVVERTPERVAVMDATAASSVLVSSELAGDAAGSRAARLSPHDDRARRGAEILSAGSRDVATAVAALRHVGGPGGKDVPPGNAAALATPLAQHQLVLDPAALRLWVGEGPGSSGRFVAIDIGAELGVEAPREPGSHVEADAALPPAQARLHVESRRLVRQAMRQAAADQLGTARRTIARALALTPTWDEPHKLAADLARKAGDTEHARKLDERLLTLSPHRRDWVDEVRARLGLR